MSIFRPFKDKKEKDKRFHFIHYVFKAKLFCPFMVFFENRLKKYIVTKRSDIPDVPHNKNFFILWDTFEETMKRWLWEFKCQSNPAQKKWNDDTWADRDKQRWYQIPKFCMRLLITIALEDTAYREEVNMLMLQLQANMNKEYDPGKQVKFPLYTNKYDMHIPYFIEWMRMQGKEGKVEIEVTRDPSKIEEAKKRGAVNVEEFREKTNTKSTKGKRSRKETGQLKTSKEGNRRKKS